LVEGHCHCRSFANPKPELARASQHRQIDWI
jgi:hypothetical protein